MQPPVVGTKLDGQKLITQFGFRSGVSVNEVNDYSNAKIDVVYGCMKTWKTKREERRLEVFLWHLLGLTLEKLYVCCVVHSSNHQCWNFLTVLRRYNRYGSFSLGNCGYIFRDKKFWHRNDGSWRMSIAENGWQTVRQLPLVTVTAKKVTGSRA